MPFLRGSLGFERFSVTGFDADAFGDEHIEILAQHAAGKFQTANTENVHVGFLGGEHLFDQDFSLEKNVINNALHCSVRIDTNKIPAAIRAAWMQMELAGMAKDSEDGTVTKAQRKEAKEAVEQRCEVEAESGKYRKMQYFPFLWDFDQELLYFGGSVGNASGLCMDLLESSFGVELRHIGAGTVAQNWAVDADRYAEVDDLLPISFVSQFVQGSHTWANEHSQAPDFLGNEFLMWLWWYLENESDTIKLADESEVTVMLNKTLALECPNAESGKESITAECPTKLPEALQAIRSGKLPRKTGMTMISDGRQFDLTLQAERFAISGAKIHLDDDEEFTDEDRIDAIRLLSQSTDMLFHVFCDLRSGKQWKGIEKKISKWIAVAEPQGQKAAA
ncbi:hypothetical protein [Stieleria varia]|uniref:Recombination-associated protein RdgC n=1 Tax=Stieleria varia TaxID=2528005 RepID=A0A5C6ASY8_9BACT|nr:hypothetical protein [Stieleria varia]TWU02820.1 hypothetical protein Pla52n_38800 [Stieleria varia]